MKNKTLTVAVGALMLTFSASANILVPGSTNIAPDTLDLSGLTFVTSATGSFTSGTFLATYITAIYSGVLTGNPVGCATTNCLTFVYQVTDTAAVGAGTGLIEHVTAFNFGNGVVTDVGFSSLLMAAPNLTSHGFVTGTIMPSSVDRSIAGPGNVITFDFTGPGGANELLPVNTSRILAIATNSTTFTSGTFSAIDGGTASNTAFAPSAPSTVPEPSTFLLLGSALMGLGFIRKRVTG